MRYVIKSKLNNMYYDGRQEKNIAYTYKPTYYKTMQFAKLNLKIISAVADIKNFEIVEVKDNA